MNQRVCFCRQQPDGEEKSESDNTSGKKPSEVPAESQPAADSVDKPQTKTERQEEATTAATSSQHRGRKIPSIPSAVVAAVSEKTVSCCMSMS